MDPNSKSKKPKKSIDFTLHSLWGKDAATVIEPEIFTASGVAHTLSHSTATIRQQHKAFDMTNCNLAVTGSINAGVSVPP